MRARFVILANGILTSPKLARIDGMETFEGESFHTSRWNYDVDLRRQAGRHHRHRRHRGAGHPRAGQGRRASSTCSSARRRRSTCATSGPPRRRRSRPGRTSRAGRGPAGPLRQDLGRPHRDPGERRLPRRQGRRLQGAQGARPRADARGADAEAARLELPDHGADPGPGRRHRRGPEDGRGAQAVLPVRLQAPDVPRRVPADVQPAQRHARRHRTDGRAARSTSAASSTTAWSTRSTC